MLTATKYLAIAGGLVFVALVVMSIVSITGRKLFSWPVPGDVEILQMCAAFASSCFFAYCHLVNGDVKVDFFTHNLAPRKVATLDAFGSLLVGLFGALIAWRTTAGALGAEGGGRNVGDPRLAGVDRAGADGARLRAARRRRLLHVHPAPAHRCACGDRRRDRFALDVRRRRTRGTSVSGTDVGFVIFGVMLTLMVVRVPIGIAMFAVGAGGYVYLTGGNFNALSIRSRISRTRACPTTTSSSFRCSC